MQISFPNRRKILKGRKVKPCKDGISVKIIMQIKVLFNLIILGKQVSCRYTSWNTANPRE